MVNKLLVLRGIFSAIPKLRGKLDPEDEICYEFAERVRYLQLEDLCRQDFIWTHIANEFAGKAKPLFGMKLKAVGKVSGWPDYNFLWHGGCGVIEFKTADKAKSKQSPAQKDVEAWCKLAGVDYRVARSASAGVEILKEWGLV